MRKAIALAVVFVAGLFLGRYLWTVSVENPEVAARAIGRSEVCLQLLQECRVGCQAP